MAVEQRVCTKCDALLPVNCFYVKDRRTGRRYTWCKKCHMALTTASREPLRDYEREKARRDADPEKFARYDLRRRAKAMGFDPDEMEARFAAHNGVCEICGRGPRESVQAKKRLTIDHSHETGEFRGLICHDCNILLGMARDSIKTLLSAISYLERS
jgi:hypothetical protein